MTDEERAAFAAQLREDMARVTAMALAHDAEADRLERAARRLHVVKQVLLVLLGVTLIVLAFSLRGRL